MRTVYNLRLAINFKTPLELERFSFIRSSETSICIQPLLFLASVHEAPVFVKRRHHTAGSDKYQVYVFQNKNNFVLCQSMC